MNLVSQEEHFEIVYDGPALKSHEMDVRDLAPALMAISDLLDESNKIVSGEKTRVQVNVKGTFKSGSFGVDLSVLHGPLQGFTSLFNSESVNAASNLLQIVGFILPNQSSSLIGFLTWLKNRKITKVEEGKTTTTIQVEDESTKVNPVVIALFSNVKIRTSLQKIIADPLSKEGVESFKIKKDGKEITSVMGEEKDYFKLSAVPDEPLQDQEREVYLKALSVIFVEGNKWKFSDGTNEFFATVKDEKFVSDVQENKITFSKDDTFKVRLREKQWITDTGLKTEHEIEEVLDHRSAAKQIKLPFDTDIKE